MCQASSLFFPFFFFIEDSFAPHYLDHGISRHITALPSAKPNRRPLRLPGSEIGPSMGLCHMASGTIGTQGRRDVDIDT